jgi:hypothetical protein
MTGQATSAAPAAHPLTVVLGLLSADARATVMSAPQDWPQ